MNAAQLTELVTQHGMTIDGWRSGAGKFRDVKIGVGRSFDELNAVVVNVSAIRPEMKRMCSITHVNNVGHKDYGKLYLEIKSFWWE